MRAAIKVSFILASVLILLMVATIAFMNVPKDTPKREETGYYMKSLDNTVVLYKDSDVVKVYDGIVVDTLPITDRELLERGIHYKNIAEADMAAEDYDG